MPVFQLWLLASGNVLGALLGGCVTFSEKEHDDILLVAGAMHACAFAWP